jgi:hypothetical protein
VVGAEFGRRGNILIQGDPGLENLQNQNFKFASDSPAAKFGFPRIPFEQIGLMADEYRRRLPSVAYEPVISPGSGVITKALTVRIAATPSPRGHAGVIRYTLDGSEPGGTSAVYSRPLTIARPVTLKAAVFVNQSRDGTRSATATATFTGPKSR